MRRSLSVSHLQVQTARTGSSHGRARSSALTEELEHPLSPVKAIAFAMELQAPSKGRSTSGASPTRRRALIALVLLCGATVALFTIQSSHPAIVSAWDAVQSPIARLQQRQAVEDSAGEGQLRIVEQEETRDAQDDAALESLLLAAEGDEADFAAIRPQQSVSVKRKPVQKTGTGRPATSKLPARPASAKKQKQLNVQVVGNFVVDGEIDTQTPLPEFKPSSSDEKFITFAPHSGLTNQRSTFANAYTLAYLLNRTLLLPDVRLGRPIPWKEPGVLRPWLERESKPALLNSCARYMLATDEGKVVRLPEACRHYHEYTRAS